MSKMQPAVTDFFKPKKRAKEDIIDKSSSKIGKSVTQSVKIEKLIDASSSSVSESKSVKQPVKIGKLVDVSSSSVSESKSLPQVEPQRFYSPVKNQNIFNSPVKLKDIKSPAKSPCRAVKRLFDATEPSSDAAPPRKIPAYQRFQHLTQKTPTIATTAVPLSPAKAAPTSDHDHALMLPLKLRVLEELFKAVESITSILHNRNEVITFTKVKSSVVKLVRRVALRDKHLGQMLAVFPGCYKLSQEKLKLPESNKFTYELVITLTLPENEKMSASLITERQKTFHQNLLTTCLQHHKKFLESQVPPIIVPNDKPITRWHPKFQLESIPDITGVALPVSLESTTSNSARDIIAKAQHIIDSANPRMKKALQDLLKKSATDESDKKVDAVVQPRLDNENVKKSVGALKGISQSLIDKIRAREQQKCIRAVTITPEESKRKVILARLPDFVKILRNVLVAEKKVAVPLEVAIERLSHSNHGTLPDGEIEEHIRMMTTVLPDWIKILVFSQGDYVKIDKAVDINELLERLKEINK